ncbi:hypothetical protein OGH69_17350 [Flavobacterium sp. MFBS3-15]|uniref:hypothetical protein n=1 Tax=Flavobacterium sp. MFBS3-15 TaxID=2989816 RepID=UPI00223547F4|nr:hypothetical protein [Flavobacterium sp. MFBS3-15]MCW4470742.1 hypothetical protein [Flavobacterium sp. MFBS3-15]
MKTLKLRLIAFIAVLATVAACSVDGGDNTCMYSAQMSTTAVTGPDTTPINTPITLNVTFRVGNDCGVFNRFLETNGYPKQVVALVDYPGCDCEDTPTATATKPYTFTANAAGTYELRFLIDTNLFITKTITVTTE